MAHPLAWPGKYFFYPIGNTPAVCLTRDLPPEESLNAILLGCGDPRNVLYTIFCEPQNLGRTLDFTCCDIDPAILARNVLLLTMVADKQPHTAIWDIFFHMYLNKDSHSTLVTQCKKLIGFSDTFEHWNASPYGPFIKMCTEYTLIELRRHWSLYADMQNLPHERLTAINNAFTKVSKYSMQHSTIISGARSAGPVLFKATQVSSEHFKDYWRTGVTVSRNKSDRNAKLLNPTFFYSLAGEGCSVHYGTDPLMPFHLAALFGNAKRPVSVSDAVDSAKAEFFDWCSAFNTSISSHVSPIPITRFILGEATAVCHTLRAFSSTGALKSGVPMAQWKTQLTSLSGDEYLSGNAPATFNVVETSNLIDHIGLLNVLIAAAPLLSTSARSNVLYTECLMSLLFAGNDATKEFKELLYADIAIVGLLLGLCPVDYLSGFTTRSNTHELFMYRTLNKASTQFHQVTTWKSPTSGDSLCSRHREERKPPAFDSRQLGTLLYDIYHDLFEQEDAAHFWRLNKNNMSEAVFSSNVTIHYMRESFVLFLELVRARLDISGNQWLDVMTRFFALKESDGSLSMDSVNNHDFCAQLYLHGLYTSPMYPINLPKIGRFSSWEVVPTLVRIILVVPRESVTKVQDHLNRAGTPLLQCDIRGTWSHNVFTAIHVAFGKVIPIGTNTRPRVLLEEDPTGWKGISPLLVSFTMPAALLAVVEPPQVLSVCLAIRSTPATSTLIPKLGLELTIFGAKLMDESHVYVLPEQPLPSRKPRVSPQTPQPKTPGLLAQIGDLSPVCVELDEQCELISSLTCRLSIEAPESKSLFGSTTRVMPQIKQVSPCVMRIILGTHMQDIPYPFPVIGSQNKVRLARKSLYIEVVVPVSGALKPDGMKINPFPVVGMNRALHPWSIHFLNLSCLPILDIKAQKLDDWLNSHVGSMMSARERTLRKRQETNTLMFVKDTLHTIFVRSSGIQGGPPCRVFALRDVSTKNCDTVFFISDLRFDLGSHTVVCNGYVLPLTNELLLKIGNAFALVFGEGMVNVPVLQGEMSAWKQLLPALVERCRTSWKHGENCEYESHGKIPLTEEMEEDPLCSCGKGKNTEGMLKVPLWRELAPYVTRIALSPLFAVSYLETVGRDPAAHKCFVCRRKGKPKLMACDACKNVRYCSKACQKKDWKDGHKSRCSGAPRAA